MPWQSPSLAMATLDPWLWGSPFLQVPSLVSNLIPFAQQLHQLFDARLTTCAFWDVFGLRPRKIYTSTVWFICCALDLRMPRKVFWGLSASGSCIDETWLRASVRAEHRKLRLPKGTERLSARPRPEGPCTDWPNEAKGFWKT